MASPSTGGPMAMGGPMWMPTQPPTFDRLVARHPQPVPILPLATLVLLTLIVRFCSMPTPAWHVVPLTHQATGGGIAWAFTEIPALLVLGALVVTWQRSDGRSTRAADRRWTRGEDTELSECNTYLPELERMDRAQP